MEARIKELRDLLAEMEKADATIESIGKRQEAAEEAGVEAAADALDVEWDEVYKVNYENHEKCVDIIAGLTGADRKTARAMLIQDKDKIAGLLARAK